MDQLRKSLAIGRRIACNILAGHKQWPTDIQKWAGEYRFNSQVIKRLEDESSLQESVRIYNRIDTEKGLAQVMRKLHQKKQRRIVFLFSSVAAVLVLFLSASLFLFDHWKFPVSNEYVENISTSHQPELILASGKRVVLENHHFEMFSEQGTMIRQDSAHNLVYKKERELLSSESVFHTLCIPLGTDYFVQLSDGTKVWLNCATTLKYPVEFIKNERRVYLDGEAYFDVAKDSRHPFIVEARGIEVKVYGTRFNVNTRNTGYVRTVLESGSVAIRDQKRQEIFLKPNQLGDYDENLGECRVSEVNIAKYISWKSGEYYFEDERLEDIMNELALWYDVTLFYANSSARDVRITCCLPKYKEIKNLLSVLESASEIHFKINGRVVVVG